MQSSFLIFIPTLNYCISLSMNERKRYAMKPPPWKKSAMHKYVQSFPFKRNVEKRGPNFSHFRG